MIQNILTYTLSLSFLTIGTLHFTHTDFFMQIMPPYIPYHKFCVLFSGLAELSIGVAVAIVSLRRYAGWAILLLLLAVFPANIHMAVNNVQIAGLPEMPLWALWARLPLQFVFAYWAWYVCIRKPSTA